jgi:enterochelin esterase family protein
MLVVMDNLNAVKPGEDASLFAARGVITKASMADVAPAGGGRGAPGGGRGGFPSNWGVVFTDMMFTDLVPMVERTYRVAPGRENRAMAGLSMGGMQTRAITLPHLDKFSHIGVFSGGSIALTNITDLAAFKKEVKLVFVSYGSREIDPNRSGGGRGGFGGDPKANTEALKEAGINSVFYVSPQTAHEWLSWRRSLYQFAPLLFKD